MRGRERGGKRKEKEKNIRERYPTAMQIFRRSIANPGASVRNGRSLYQKWTCRFASPGHARKYDMRDLENGAFGSWFMNWYEFIKYSPLDSCTVPTTGRADRSNPRNHFQNGNYPDTLILLLLLLLFLTRASLFWNVRSFQPTDVFNRSTSRRLYRLIDICHDDYLNNVTLIEN